MAIHDAARPCLTEDMVTAVFAAGREHGAAFLAVPVSDTIKRTSEDGLTTETIPRHGLFLAQTPQVFRRDWLEQAHARLRNQKGQEATDDTQLVEALGHRCAVVAGSIFNLKITTQDDLRLAAAILRMPAKDHRASSGHPFADEAEKWNDLPRLKPTDLFDS